MQLNKMKEDLTVHPNKFHNFMVYEAIKRALSGREFDSKMTGLMEQARLGEEEKSFFYKG